MKSNYFKYAFSLIGLSLSFFAIAQEDAAQLNNVEEVVVVGSQIKGAKITGALPVSVLTLILIFSESVMERIWLII